MAVPNSQFQAGTAAVPATQVEISASCRGLRDLDTFSKSDPMCVMFTRDPRSGQYYEFGRTEVINDNLNPDFVKKFVINYYFEESQKLKFEIYDVDSKNSRLSDHISHAEVKGFHARYFRNPNNMEAVRDFIGRIECTLGELVAYGGKFEKPLQGPTKNNGKILLRAEELSNCKELINMQFKCTNLDKKDFFGKSDPYLEFQRVNEDNSFTVVHRTEVIKNTLNPTWRQFAVPARSLCNGDYDRSILIKCWDWNSNGSADYIGQFTTNLRELTRGPGPNNAYDVINEQKRAKKKGKYKNSGQAILLSCQVTVEHSFLDYIASGTEMAFTVAIDFTASNGKPANPSYLHYLNPYGGPNQYISLSMFKITEMAFTVAVDFTASNGNPANASSLHYLNLYGGPNQFISLSMFKITEMAFTVAIDFTASNGNPANPSSLHYLNPYGGPNQYATAIQSVGEIIQDYDTDKLFPALGFGARFPDGSTQHEFALNFNIQNPYCQGVPGILGAYHNALKSVQLYGPTNFAPCINHVARFARSKMDGSAYFTLLIITDGVITDMPQTTQAIVEASTLPMSIIIVGVGDADFEAMDVLDGDDVRLSYGGKVAARDIVQFVPLRNFLMRGEQTTQAVQAALAKEVLAEIPQQFLDYMKSHNVIPRARNPASAPPPL